MNDKIIVAIIIILVIFFLVLLPEIEYIGFKKYLQSGNPVIIKLHKTKVAAIFVRRNVVNQNCLVRIDNRYFIVDSDKILRCSRFNYRKQVPYEV